MLQPGEQSIASLESEVLQALSNIQDPDLGTDIVSCDFVKDLSISRDGQVAFRLQLTTPACPVKDEFLRQVSFAYHLKVSSLIMKVLYAALR